MSLFSPTTKIKINIVAFLLGALGLSYAMATQVLSILEDRYSVFAIFPDAGGVFTNQEVTYRGVQVGNVGTMEVIDEGVKLELLIAENWDIPADDVQARVMFKSAVGEQFVDLLPASRGEPFLQDGDTIPLERTDIPVSTQELLSTLEAVLEGVPPEALKGAVDALGEGLTGRGQDLATILESSADLAELFAERAPEVRGILRSGTKVGRAFLASSEDFKRAIDELVTVSQSLEDSTGDLQRLLIGANLTSDQAVALIRENREELNEFVHEFAEVNALQAKHADDLQALFKSLPTALEGVVASFEPSTGLVRFGLVTELEGPACSYGTERRPPPDRSPRLPPRNARCGDGPPAQPTAEQKSASNETTDVPASSAGGLLDLLDDDAPTLPTRMNDWSWTLFYLRAMEPGV